MRRKTVGLSLLMLVPAVATATFSLSSRYSTVGTQISASASFRIASAFGQPTVMVASGGQFALCAGALGAPCDALFRNGLED